MKRRIFMASSCVLVLPQVLTRANAAEAVPGVSKSEILFGQTSDFSSSRAVISKAYAEGTALAFDPVNAAGGIFGRKLRVAKTDDGYVTSKALENARDLVEDQQVFGLVHCLGTGIMEKVIPYTEEHRIPNIHPLTGADSIRPPAFACKYTQFLRASYGREVERIVAQLRSIGITRIALMHEAEPFGESIKQLAKASLASAQLELSAVGICPFNKPNEVGAAVAAIAKVEPTAIMIGAAGPSVENFIRAYHNTGKRAQIYCLSVSNVERLHKNLGSLAEGIVITEVMPAITSNRFPIVVDYREAARAAQIQPSSFSLEGYISGQMIVRSLRTAGPALNREKFIRAISDPKFVQIGGFPVQYTNGERSGSPFVDVAMIGTGGKLLQ